MKEAFFASQLHRSVPVLHMRNSLISIDVQNAGRTILRLVVSFAIVAAITFFCHGFLHVNPATVGFAFLLAVLAISAAWGLRHAVFLAAIATLAYNFFFLPPAGTFAIADPQNWIALGAFLLTAVIGSHLAHKARQEALKAIHRRHELERLYTFSQRMLASDNVLGLVNALPQQVVEVFGGVAAAMLLLDGSKVYYSDVAAQAMITREDLQHISARGEPSVDSAKGICYMPLQVGLRPVGAIAVIGNTLSRESMEAISSLVAIAIERAAAVEKLAHAEATRENERLRSLLLDSVTHDFRTPLTSIKASAQSLMSDARLDESARAELLTVINEETDRLDRLVGEAAEMAQLDAHAVQLDLKPHHIREAVDAAVEEAKNVLGRHAVEVQVGHSLPPVNMDVRRIEEVLAQLLDNAGKYAPPGTPITIMSEVRDRALVTSVADRGPGIDGVDQSMIFERFYRASGQRKSAPGTGMGLAIAKAIVEAHGGDIGVTSQIGRGSVFHFSLPIT
jgi:two-component system, OmpR family, sensor histidine kinase KdpD